MSIVPASDGLTSRLRANRQRRNRENLINTLPEDLAGLLRDAPCLTEPESEVFLPYFRVFAESAGSAPEITPPGFEYFDTGRPSRVREHLNSNLPFDPEAKAIFAIADDLPCFRVRFGAVAPFFAQFFETLDKGMLLITEDLKTGIAVSNYVGYHPDDQAGKEVIYEVGTWSRSPE
jgi:hypothetical protein